MDIPQRKDFINRIGAIYGRLTVISYAGNDGKTNTNWNCLCECGNTIIVRASFLRRGETRSCGCLHKDSVTRHGMTGTPEYNSWSSMKARCDNPKSSNYKQYGARGIKYIKEWEDFSIFYKDMGARPRGTTLDRLNNNKGYSKENCRWSTFKQQNRNTRKNVLFIIDDIQMTIAEAAELHSINKATVYDRLKNGWDINRALKQPVKKVW